MRHILPRHGLEHTEFLRSLLVVAFVVVLLLIILALLMAAVENAVVLS
jgi:hypothetical protein